MTTTVTGLSADRTPSLSWSTVVHVPHHPAADTTPTPLEGIDPRFVFDFRSYDEPDDDRQRWSTWLSVEPLCRGPEPRPDWVVTSQAAVDTELGILKTGKEADVFLLERAVPGSEAVGESVVMAAKRYRGEDHRDFHRSAATPTAAGSATPATPARWPEVGLRPGRGGRPVGLGRVGVAQAALGARSAGPLPRPDRRHRAADGVDHRRRRDRAAAGADPTGRRTCWRRTSSRCATSSPRWRATGWSTATCRPTTSWPPVSGWS